MHVLVFVGAIVDPRKPLPRTPDLAALMQARLAHPLLSPFDEAALELALKLRDADPTVEVSALLAAHGPQDPLLRVLASHRLAHTAGLDVRGYATWDAMALAAALAHAVAAWPTRPDLYLIGREFGDFDDGTVPAALAHQIDAALASQVLGIRATSGGWCVTRQRAGRVQEVEMASGLLAAVTNDAANRLRHPLLKNVMAARKANFELLSPPPPPHADLQVIHVDDATPPPRSEPCEMLAGPPPDQARALLDRLREWLA